MNCCQLTKIYILWFGKLYQGFVSLSSKTKDLCQDPIFLVQIICWSRKIYKFLKCCWMESKWFHDLQIFFHVEDHLIFQMFLKKLKTMNWESLGAFFIFVNLPKAIILKKGKFVQMWSANFHPCLLRWNFWIVFSTWFKIFTNTVLFDNSKSERLYGMDLIQAGIFELYKKIMCFSLTLTS